MTKGNWIAIIAIVVAIFANGVTIYVSNEGTQENIAKFTDLLNKTNKQVTILDETLKEIQHQTILNAYTNGGKFSMIIDKGSCSTHGGTTDSDGNFLERRIDFKPIMVSESGAQTIVPFRIFGDLIFIGKQSPSDKQGITLFKENASTNYDTNNEEDYVRYEMQDILNDAHTNGYSFVEIKYRYSFKPYSPIKENFRIADESETKEMHLAIMEFKDFTKWHGMDIPDKYECRS